MKRSRFSEEQIIGILKKHEAGVSVGDLCRKHGVSDASIYNWKARFGGMDVTEARRPEGAGGREHAPEAAFGRRHARQCRVEGPCGKEMVTPAAKRKAVARLKEGFGMSERRACKAIGCCRMTVRYQTSRPDDREVRERMKADRAGASPVRLPASSRDAEAGGPGREPQEAVPALSGGEARRRRRGGRKRAIGTRAPMLVPLRPDERWSLDFVSDQLTDGRRFRILAVVDDCTRECLALIVDTSLSGMRVARELDGSSPSGAGPG